MTRIIEETKLDFDDVLIKPKRSFVSSRSEVNLEREFYFPYSTKPLECVPVMAANMDTTGSLFMAQTLGFHRAITCLHKHYEIEDYLNLYRNYKFNKDLVFLSTGTNNNDFEKLSATIESIQALVPPVGRFNKFTPNICVDVANGYTEQFVRNLEKIRKKFKDSIIMAGNVVSPEMTEELIIHGGVDIVKVGIGSGSVCTTRLKTGVGYPQLSAVMECSDAAHGLGAHICSDGGCRTPADVAKAFGAGADFVMLGSMLAGTNECDGEWEYEYKCETKPDKLIDQAITWWQPIDPKNGGEKRKRSLKFYGMSSKEAQEKHHAGVKDYRTSEGRCVSIPYKGTADAVIKDLFGGLRSACTYIGAFQIKDFSKKTTFIRVNNTHNRIYEK